MFDASRRLSVRRSEASGIFGNIRDQNHLSSFARLGGQGVRPYVFRSLRGSWWTACQQASWSRVSFRPFRLPRTVTAIDSVWKNSWASWVSCSTVTFSIRSMSSSSV